jgi:hypothetical protein
MSPTPHSLDRQTSQSADVAVGQTVHDLRRRWKPHKERLQQLQPDHATSIRIHRACSWLQRVEETAAGKDLDLAFVSQWVAFNALYGQWDAAKRQTAPDRESWRQFLDRILKLDVDQRVTGVLQEHKRLVMSLLEDAYLSNHFWREPARQAAVRGQGVKFRAATWYLEGRWTMILDEVLDRIYLLRCQLMHGAATYGGKLNRTALKRGSIMLGHLLPALVTVIADHGADEDWGKLCYPPLK